MTKTKTGIARVLAILLILTLALTMIPLKASAAASSDVTFTFSDSGITASGSSDNYEIDGTTLTITGAGTYTVTGSCSNGSVVVKKGTTGVTLILKDLTLSASDTAPVVLKKTTEVTIDIEGTVTLNDNEDPNDEESTDEVVADAFEGAAIKVKDGGSLVLTGSGTLNVNAESCKNGIKGGATATITVKSGTYNIKAAKNGLASDGELIIAGGTVNVTAGNDGIKADPDTDDTESKGDLTITGGTVTVNAGDDGIKAGYDLVIGTKGSTSGPTINIQKSNEGIEGATITLNSGSGTITSADDGMNAANSDLTNYTYLLTINGGEWLVNADGDGLDSNGNLVNNGGSVVVYGSANDGNAAIDIGDMGSTWSSNGGSILAIGMSGMALVPNSGTYVAFGATGMGGMGGNPGNMGGQAPSGNMGNMTPPSGNGNTTMTTMANNTASSGTISITKGSTITIKDSSGNTVATATGMKNANSVVYTGDDLKSGETYTLYVNDTAAGTATATTGNGQSSGGNPGGMTPPDDNGGQTPPSDNGGNSTNNYPENTTPFTDVGTKQWYTQAINEAYSSKIMAGTSSTTFSPNMELTRGMLVQMLYALEGKPAVTTKTTFSDVSSSAYYYDAMGWAQKNGIIAGYSDGTVGPTDKLTREQAVVILNAYAKYKNASSGNSKAITSFSDASKVSSWASSAVQWAYGNGLLGGFEDNTLRPQSTTTRAQMAQIMMQYTKLINK